MSWPKEKESAFDSEMLINESEFIHRWQRVWWSVVAQDCKREEGNVVVCLVKDMKGAREAISSRVG